MSPDPRWPPTGVEPLRGKLDGTALKLLWSSTTASLLTLGVISRGTGGTSVLGMDSIGLVVIALVVSVLWAILAIDYLRFVCQMFYRGRRAGFRWHTMLEVAADPYGDTGELISGGDKASALAADTRQSVRTARLAATLVPLTAALLILVVFILRVRFGSAESSDTPTMVRIVVLAVAAFTCRWVLRRWEAARWPRDRWATRMRPAEELRALAERWRTANTAAEPTTPADSAQGAPPVVAHVAQGLVILLAAATFVATMTVVLASIAGPALVALAAPNFGAVERRYQAVLPLQRFALPVDSGITALDAGIAIATMDYSSRTRASAFSLRDRAPLAPPPWLDSAPPSMDLARNNAGDGFKGWIDSTPRRLSREEMAFMRRVVEYPGWAYVRTAARAPHIDLIGGLVELPLADSGTAFDLPFSPVSSLRGYARANAFRVRYYLETNQRDSAVYAAREILSLGLGMAREARLTIDLLIGVSIAQEARSQLERTYGVLRDAQRDTLLRLSRDGAMRAAEMRTDASPSSVYDASRLTADWRSAVVSADRMRVVRWESAMLLGFSSCTNARGVLRGPDAETRAAFDTFMTAEARWASDSAVLQLIRDTPLRRPASASEADDPIAYRVARAVGTVLGTPYIAGCMRLAGAVWY